jgi:ankyrin repeat protein
MTLLHISVKNNFFEITKFLISNGSNVNSIDKFLRTPLHISCSNSNNEITLLLLSSSSNLFKKDIYGKNNFKFF